MSQCTCASTPARASVPMGDRERVRHVEEAFEPVRALLDGMDAHPEVQAFGRDLLASFVDFGACELRLQRSEKLGAVGEAAADEGGAAAELNALGVARLREARAALAEAETAAEAWDKSTRRAIDVAGLHFREALVDLPLKTKDVGKLWETWTRAASAESLDALRSQLVESADRLVELRESESRGTEDNIPWWKLVAAAAIVGISVWGVVCCNARSCWCPTWMMALANVALAIAVGTLWFC